MLVTYKVRTVFATLFSLFVSASVEADILLFSGANDNEFLGCYDCSKYQSGSICNKYGTYGSKYSSSSIWNKYGTYGSKYSSSSPWNKYTSSDDVPVMVDESGNFYGYLTINSYRSDAFRRARKLKQIFEEVGGDIDKLRDVICD